MKRITLLFLLFFTQIIFAQFNAADVKYFVGTGSKTAYLVVDFNDDNEPTSYVWGYRFNDTNLTMEDLITAIDTDEAGMISEIPSGFLYSLNYNHHIPSEDDYWSTWSGTASNNMTMNNGVNNDALIDGKWYGLSYGYGFTPTTPPMSHPSEPVPAYSSQWYKKSDIVTWLGTGSNQSLVVVDFGTDTNNVADSYVFGIQYNGSITAEAALDLINTELNGGFDYVMTANVLSSVTIGTRTETAVGTTSWKAYSGTDLSSWKTESDLSLVTLDNNVWLGLSIGTRRPFTPQDITAALSTSKHNSIEENVYPNPTSDILNIQTAESITNVTAYNIAGQKVLQANTQTLNVSALKAGVYILKVETVKGSATLKFVKK